MNRIEWTYYSHTVQCLWQITNAVSLNSSILIRKRDRIHFEKFWRFFLLLSTRNIERNIVRYLSCVELSCSQYIERLENRIFKKLDTASAQAWSSVTAITLNAKCLYRRPLSFPALNFGVRWQSASPHEMPAKRRKTNCFIIVSGTGVQNAVCESWYTFRIIKETIENVPHFIVEYSNCVANRGVCVSECVWNGGRSAAYVSCAGCPFVAVGVATRLPWPLCLFRSPSLCCNEQRLSWFMWRIS